MFQAYRYLRKRGATVLEVGTRAYRLSRRANGFADRERPAGGEQDVWQHFDSLRNVGFQHDEDRKYEGISSGRHKDEY